jgi:Uma2 family endonuclease
MNMNAAARPFSGTMDLDEFMDFLETRPDGEHWELIEGVAVMMAPASYAHRRITRNFCELLNGACAAGNVDLFAYFDVGVRSPGVRNFQPQPDVVVVPGVAGANLYSENFQLAAEVSSPSNTRTEIGLKLRRHLDRARRLDIPMSVSDWTLLPARMVAIFRGSADNRFSRRVVRRTF